MRVTTTTYSRTTASADEGEFNLDYEPASEVELKIVGDRAVVGYLVYDPDCENPMTSNDCMGEFITEDTRNDSPWGHLGLLEKPYRGEIQRDLECDGVQEEALRILLNTLGEDTDFIDFCDEQYERADGEKENNILFAESCLSQIDFQYDYNVPAWLEAKYEVACEDAWDKLYEQGKIGTFLAVPFYESIGGSGPASAYPCSIEDCNAVWIPTKDDIDNIKAQVWPAGVEIKYVVENKINQATVLVNGKIAFQSASWPEAQAWVDANFPAPNHSDLYNAAVRYAKGCLDQYVTWCNGECYGTVVQCFSRNGDEWEEDGPASDSCWGFIGDEYAEEEMKSVFNYQAKHFLKEAA
jgi:hypothetical protein